MLGDYLEQLWEPRWRSRMEKDDRDVNGSTAEANPLGSDSHESWRTILPSE